MPFLASMLFTIRTCRWCIIGTFRRRFPPVHMHRHFKHHTSAREVLLLPGTHPAPHPLWNNSATGMCIVQFYNTLLKDVYCGYERPGLYCIWVPSCVWYEKNGIESSLHKRQAVRSIIPRLIWSCSQQIHIPRYLGRYYLPRPDGHFGIPSVHV